jgi:hypothetical protein
VLPGIACAGEDKCNDEPENITAQTASHTDHEDEKEDCGSFCTCSCCIHIVSVNFQQVAVMGDKPLLKNRQLSTYYSISLPSNFFGNIWQPPRMS